MNVALRAITTELTEISPSLHLALQDTGAAYQLSDILVSRIQRDVYITIKFPITPVTQIFTLYNVIVFPVLMPDGSPHNAYLETPVKAIAYEPTAAFYLEFREYPTVRNRVLFMPEIRDVFRPRDSYSCIFALFRNAADHVHSLCSFALVPRKAESSIMMVDAEHVLFTNVPNVTRHCMNMPPVSEPYCVQCIHKLPC